MKTKNNLPANTFSIQLVSVLILSLIACSKEAATIRGNNHQTQINSSTQSNAASVYTTSEKFDVSLGVFVDCANNGSGENVLLEGTLHETYHLNIDNDRFQLKVIDNPQGISAAGDVTGDTYHATGVTEQEFSGSFAGGRYEDSYVNNFRIIGQGTGNNYIVHETYHITINPDGTITSLLDNLTIDCK